MLARQKKLEPLDVANIYSLYGLADYVVSNLSLQIVTLQRLIDICASL